MDEHTAKHTIEYWRHRCRNAERALTDLLDRCKDEIADPEDVSEIYAANQHLGKANREDGNAR